MNVLIGVDGSTNSFVAVEFAARLLSPDADEIALYYSPPDIHLHTRAELQPDIVDRLHKSLTAAVFEKALQRLPETFRSRTQTIAGTQKAAHGLVVAADEFAADLIVVGARGTSTAKHKGLGSVGRHVVHATRLPVMVVRPKANGTEAFRILLACDGSQCSRNAGKLLHRFTLPEGSVGRLITVVESLVAGHIPEWLETQLRENESATAGIGFFEQAEEEARRARENLRRLSGELPPLFLSFEPIVVQGQAAQQIVQTIESEDTDLVVVGARRLGPLGRFFIGSTSDHLLTHAPCSVLVVHEHEEP